MRVLFVNHTSTVSGAELSLLECFDGLGIDIIPVLACPDGELAERARARGIEVAAIPAMNGSLRLHPWHTTRAVIQLARQGHKIRQLASRLAADLVHANSIRAGLAATTEVAKTPVVVHVRDCLSPRRTADLVRNWIGTRAGAIIANSRYTASHFQGGKILRAPVHVAYSPVDLERFNPDRVDRVSARARLGLIDSALAIGVVAQITPWKGQETAIRALAAVRTQVPGALLLLVGTAKFLAKATRLDNLAYETHLHHLAAELGVSDAVRFIGEREDVPEVMRALDVLLAPSDEEPFGRSVVEGMAMGLPVVATSCGGPSEVVEHGTNGFLIAPDELEPWIQQLRTLLTKPDLRDAVGVAARTTAARFDKAEHARVIESIWNSTIANSRPRERDDPEGLTG